MIFTLFSLSFMLLLRVSCILVQIKCNCWKTTIRITRLDRNDIRVSMLHRFSYALLDELTLSLFHINISSYTQFMLHHLLLCVIRLDSLVLLYWHILDITNLENEGHTDLCQDSATYDASQRSLNNNNSGLVVFSCTWWEETFKTWEWELLQPGRWGVECAHSCVCVLSSLQSRNAHRQAPAFMVQLKVKLITPAVPNQLYCMV